MDNRKRGCIFGCDITGIPLHKFPNPDKYPDQFAQWISIVGDALKERDPMNIFRNKRVCDRHFIPKHKTTGHRLVQSAYPILFLEGVPRTLITIIEEEHKYGFSAFAPSTSTDSSNLIPQGNINVIGDKHVQPLPMHHAPSLPTQCTFKENISSTLVPSNSPDSHGKHALKGVPKSLITIIEKEHNYGFSALSLSTSTDTSNSTSQGDKHVQPFPMHHAPSLPTQFTFKENRPSTSVASNSTDSFGKHAVKVPKVYTPMATTENKTIETKRQLRYMKNEIYRLRQKNKIMRRNERVSQIHILEKVMENMSDSAKLLTRIQAEETKKKKKGRRYTMDERVLALSLYKRSPKTYRFLSRILTLPSPKSLKQLLSRIQIHPGINEAIFQELKKTVPTLDLEDRLVTLIFDEMSLTPQIFYNARNDEFIGFEDLGNKKTSKFADHALVFMIKGIRANYKQPVAYYLSHNMKGIELKEIITLVIQNVQKCGLIVVATVCDQSSLNVCAINSLVSDTKAQYLRSGKEWRKELFEINTKEIIPLYDVPHLMKGLRNNLLNKDLIYKDLRNRTERTVKWEYFKKVFEADKNRGELTYLHKITKEHIDPKSMKKMKVKIATQVLSHSVAVVTDHLVKTGDVPKECADIIPFLLKIDQLFDSLNSSTFQIPDGKIYKGPVRKNSPHHGLWQECIIMLKSAKFVKDSVEKSVPTLRNFVKTIEGFQVLWQTLYSKYSLDCMLTRNFNQDPIEIFFGNIRSIGARNVFPNCMGFEGAFKTLLVNNFTSAHSVHANCEEDFNTSLQSYLFLINKENKYAPSDSHHIIIDKPLQDINKIHDEDDGMYQRHYVTGWILSKCLQDNVKGCKNCKKDLCGDAMSKGNDYIRLKEYNKNKKWLCYPSIEMANCFKDIQNIVISFLQSEPYLPKFKDRTRSFIECFVSFDFIKCNLHKNKVIDYMKDSVINIILYSWCRSVNRILTGKINYEENDDKIKRQAQEYYIKHKTKP